MPQNQRAGADACARTAEDQELRRSGRDEQDHSHGRVVKAREGEDAKEASQGEKEVQKGEENDQGEKEEDEGQMNSSLQRCTASLSKQAVVIVVIVVRKHARRRHFSGAASL